jgi:hypothetical protein
MTDDIVPASRPAFVEASYFLETAFEALQLHFFKARMS